MKFVHHLVFIAVGLSLGGCSSLGPAGPQQDKTYRISILHTNDHHGRFWKNGDGEYGMAARKTLIDGISAEVAASELAQIKPGAIVLNTSRGAIVDEAALLAGLKSGRIGAAGIDVLDGEPEIADHPLLAHAREHDNLLITPHCGGFSPDAVAIVERE